LDIGYFRRHGKSCGRHEQKPTNDFSNSSSIQHKIPLTSANVDEVLRKRLLKKDTHTKHLVATL
jgi:hypothetical protein